MVYLISGMENFTDLSNVNQYMDREGEGLLSTHTRVVCIISHLNLLLLLKNETDEYLDIYLNLKSKTVPNPLTTYQHLQCHNQLKGAKS